MAPVFKIVMAALLSSTGSGAVPPGRPKLGNGVNDSAVLDFPDNTYTPTVTESIDPDITFIIAGSDSVSTGTTFSHATGSAIGSINLQVTRGGVVTGPTTPTSIIGGGTSCPIDQSSYFWNERTHCCPDTFYGLGTDTFCGKYCSRGLADPATISPTDLSCSSIMWVVYDEYDSLVAAAVSQARAAASPRHGTAPTIVRIPMLGIFAVACGILLAV